MHICSWKCARWWGYYLIFDFVVYKYWLNVVMFCCNDDYCCLQVPHDEPVITWSTISKEAKSLLHLNGIAAVSPSHSSALRAKRGSKGIVPSWHHWEMKTETDHVCINLLRSSELGILCICSCQRQCEAKIFVSLTCSWRKVFQDKWHGWIFWASWWWSGCHRGGSNSWMPQRLWWNIR